jgi:hypothetical protein
LWQKREEYRGCRNPASGVKTPFSKATPVIGLFQFGLETQKYPFIWGGSPSNKTAAAFLTLFSIAKPETSS